MLMWLIILCIYLTYWLEKFACVLGLSNLAVGSTLGAIGTSLPDFLCSLYVARRGYGLMATTNVWGSNIWLIYVCLGLPWGIKTFVSGNAVIVSNTVALSIWFALVYCIYFGIAAYTGFVFTRKIGIFLLALYAAFVVFVFAYSTAVN